jgi:hypothetical protein
MVVGRWKLGGTQVMRCEHLVFCEARLDDLIFQDIVHAPSWRV